MTEIQADAPGRRRAGVERWLRAEIAEAANSGVRRAIVLGALAAALAVPQAWLLAHAIAPVVMEKASVSSALPWLLPVLPLLLLRFFLATASGRAALVAAGRVKARIRSALLRHLASLGPATNAGRSTGEAATSCSKVSMRSTPTCRASSPISACSSSCRRSCWSSSCRVTGFPASCCW
ncbi:hypothetical protein [Reyranella sp.]|uniref:hypothetical protein n=1 Tax=Reyranella sp. TaxID=1929291 RepID=UPI00271B9D07|nr:hypothetical protein [Reyranella sp.]MDO8973050.1 hypothetical protein [Reyranella sp.]